MNATSDGVPAGTTHGATERRLSRRTVMVGAAWSVPAIVAMTTTPAYAVSGVTRTVSVATTNMQVTASGSTQVKAQVKDNGSPAVGAAVSFSGPSGSSFAPASPTTDSSGTAQTNLTLGNTWAKPGSTVTVTAVSGSATASQGLTVTGANLLAAGSGYTSSFGQEALVFPSPIVQATASDFSGTYVLLQDGTVWSKGRNGSGQLGDGTTTDRISTWAMIAGLSGVTQLVAGGQSAYALLSDGSVRAWGSNNQGQLGDGTTTDRYTPVSVMASSSVVLTGVTQIAGGYSSGHALMSDGRVKSWGANDHGQLGDGTGSMQLYPVTAMTGFDPSHPFASLKAPLQNATQIASGRYTVYARISDGTVRAWGYNVNGQVGDGNSGNSADQGLAVPVRTTASTDPSGMTALKNVAAVTAGSFSGYAVLTDKTAVAWGRNAGGELGNGQIGGQEPRPVAVQNLTDISMLSGGREFCVAMQADGTVLTWGNNYSGQLGNGSTSARPLPGPVSSLQGQTVSALGVQPQAFATFLITAV